MQKKTTSASNGVMALSSVDVSDTFNVMGKVDKGLLHKDIIRVTATKIVGGGVVKRTNRSVGVSIIV